MRGSPLLRSPTGVLAAFVLAVATQASAQSIDETRARADALFREGQQLVTAGQVAAGCAKLEESQRLDPKLGRLLNVAYCHDKQGLVATAWREYNQAAAMAIQTGQPDREKFARDQASALAKRLSFLRLDVGTVPEGGEVSVDGKPLARAEWALPFAVDPGPHTITVRAAGYKPRTQSVNIAATGTVRVPVEALEKEQGAPAASSAAATPAPPSDAPTNANATTATAPTAAPDEQPAARGGGGSRIAGWIVGGVGVVAAGVGIGFGVDAMSLKNQADPQCPGHMCTPNGQSLIDNAKTAATVSTVGIVVGAVAIGVGAFLLLRPGPSPAAARATVAPFFAGDRAGLAVQGAW